ncbi:putative potassium transporter [Lupinus albus]|uniref:Putative potassium transporter n=1 Tax=Lupinus albus TaxID=3870 RepID=A0A6A4QHK2_LUPAL|nr:putative potassium transporter [Lupinus albus]
MVGSGGIKESSTRLLDSFSNDGSSEVDSMETPPSWTNEGRDGYGSLRRRFDASLLPTLALAFQTLGVVYGDMGTNPLYVFADVFSKVPIETEVDILGALSLVVYTIAVIPLAKYVFIVLKANDNGEGNTFSFPLRYFIKIYVFKGGMILIC